MQKFDTDGFHDNATNNERLTIPAILNGKYVELGAVISCTSATADLWTELRIYHYNVSDVFQSYVKVSSEVGFTSPSIELITAPYNVSTGDYFQVRFQIQTDTSITIEEEYSHFWIKALGG